MYAAELLTHPLLTHPLAQRLTWTLTHFLWQGLVIAALLVLVVELLRIRQPGTRYACSLAALVLMLLMIPVTWLAIELPATEAAAMHSQPTVATGVADLSPSLWTSLQPALFTGWVLGCSLLQLRIVISWLAMRRLLLNRHRLPADVAARLARLGSRFRVSISPATGCAKPSRLDLFAPWSSCPVPGCWNCRRICWKPSLPTNWLTCGGSICG
jgi:hypothetical protein